MPSSWPWLMITCWLRPTPESLRSSWMSSRRHDTPLIAYSLSPLRNNVRLIVTSENSIGRAPSALSMVRLTSARPSAERLAEPAKMTSSIFEERTVRGPWAPSTQATASTTFDLPEPLGPTTTVMPGSKSSTALSAKDLKPLMTSDFRYTVGGSLVAGGEQIRDHAHLARSWGTGPRPAMPVVSRCHAVRPHEPR